MPTIASGNEVEVYVPLTSTVTITPSGRYVEFGCATPSGTAAVDRRNVYAAETITVPAGSKLFMRSVGGSATYTDPAGLDTSLQALVAGTVLWANRPASPTLYDQIFVTDIGPNGTSFWWNGTRWKVLYPSVIGEDATILTGAAQTADQYLGGLGPFPVGLIAAGDVLAYYIGLGKNGTTDAYGTSTSIRLGAGGVIADSVALASNLSSTMVAGVRGVGIEKWIRFESATTIRGLGPNNGSSSWNGLSTTSATAEATSTIINISTTPWYIGISTTMGGTTNAPQLTYQRLVLLP